MNEAHKFCLCALCALFVCLVCVPKHFFTGAGDQAPQMQDKVGWMEERFQPR